MITALMSVLLCAAMAFTPAPRDFLSAEMILAEAALHGEMERSGSPADAGQCRRFQVNVFAEAAGPYRLADYPDAALFLPADHAPSDVSGRPVGACWDMPDASMGNPFVEAARFDLDPGRTPAQNKAAARAFLTELRAGDLVQMLARYSSGGRGTHTFLVTRPCDPRTGMLYWSDSNFANTLIDGVRYGYVRAYQAWPFEEVVGWLVSDGNNGATLYRLREDIVRAR